VVLCLTTAEKEDFVRARPAGGLKLLCFNNGGRRNEGAAVDSRQQQTYIAGFQLPNCRPYLKNAHGVPVATRRRRKTTPFPTTTRSFPSAVDATTEDYSTQ